MALLQVLQKAWKVNRSITDNCFILKDEALSSSVHSARLPFGEKLTGASRSHSALSSPKSEPVI